MLNMINPTCSFDTSVDDELPETPFGVRLLSLLLIILGTSTVQDPKRCGSACFNDDSMLLVRYTSAKDDNELDDNVKTDAVTWA